MSQKHKLPPWARNVSVNLYWEALNNPERETTVQISTHYGVTAQPGWSAVAEKTFSTTIALRDLGLIASTNGVLYVY